MKKNMLIILSLFLIGLFVISCSPAEVEEVKSTEPVESEVEAPVIEPEVEEETPPELPPFLEEPEPVIEEKKSEPAPPVVESKIVKVKTSGMSFSPDEVTINAGDIIEFTTSGSHNAVEVSEADWEAGKKTAKEGGFSVGFGDTKTITFDSPGTYYYVCQPHASMGMKGKIIVQ